MGVSQKNYKLCDQLQEEVSDLQQKRRELQSELNLLIKKEKRADKYQLKKNLEEIRSAENIRSSETPMSSESEMSSSDAAANRRGRYSRDFSSPSPSPSQKTAPVSFSGRIKSMSPPSQQSTSQSNPIVTQNPRISSLFESASLQC